MAIGHMKNRKINNPSFLRKPAADIGYEVMNLELVDRHFEDLSIPASKIIGSIAPSAHAPTHSNGGSDEITVENLGTANVNIAYALKPDGAGGLAFGAVGGGAFSYTVGYGLYGTYNLNTVGGYAVQIGYSASAPDDYGISIGKGSLTDGLYGINIGSKSGNTRRSTQGTVAVGFNAGVYYSATGTFNVLIGYDVFSLAAASYGISIGVNSSITGSESITIGHQSRGYGEGVIAIGKGAQGGATHAKSVAIGYAVRTIAADTVTFGVSNTAKISFGDFAPAVATPAQSHTLDVTISGSVYKLLLST